MTDDSAADADITNDDHAKNHYHFDRHSPDYRFQFESIAAELQEKCPIAWSDTYGGHWVASSSQAVFELARCPHISNDHDVNGERRGYQGITIPAKPIPIRGGMLEMDPPEHRTYRNVLNPFLSPAAVKRWDPFVAEVVRASIDEKIEDGRIDFVDDLANVAPAVITLAMLGIPLEKWHFYSEPTHALLYTPEDSPEMAEVIEQNQQIALDLLGHIADIRENPRPGIINALVNLRIDGEPAPEMEILGMLILLIGGGFDTTTALTAHSLEWLGQHPDQRERLNRERGALLDAATEEFLRFYAPAPGDGRTFSEDTEIEGIHFKEGERLYISWAMANRDPSVFTEPNKIILDRKGNRHYGFGLGIHRCIGSNLGRSVFKAMLTATLDRMPDYECDPESTVHYETIGVIQGMRHLPASFTPGKRLGPGLDETLRRLQKICDEQELARPITELKSAARVD
ncbi:cytochrome P450 [Mycolicibacterium palauense]|uniref:cytochrome P450 n=1 Tax=Mycolicibacterium palauense TaxID=2034511 RepID=UPI000BFF0112|nr:cytochrome P450 [Mycolicibacterium palauense]